MNTFTIDEQNQIVAYATAEEAAAAATTPFHTFTTREQLAELAAQWPAERLLAIWNTLPGVPAAKHYKNAQALLTRIWQRIQRLAEPPAAKAPAVAAAGAQGPKGAPAARRASSKTTRAGKAAKAKTRAQAAEPAKAPRPGSKAALVITLLRRKNGATLAEIMEKMHWQKHYADVQIMPTCVGNAACGAVSTAMESA